MKEISPITGSVATIGVTGHPGSGKSCLVGLMARELALRGERVGVIAVDPSSQLSGGAFLADRLRMNTAALDGVYIRSIGSRGAMGGLQQSIRDIIRIMEASGKSAILIETIGVGQNEISIAGVAQLVLLVCAPGQGDGIQYLKAGVMEIADIYVANKADLPETERIVSYLRSVVSQNEDREKNRERIFKTCALTGEGISALVDEIQRHVSAPWSNTQKHRALAMEEIVALLREKISNRIAAEWVAGVSYNTDVDALMEGRKDPYSLSDDILEKMFPCFQKPDLS